MIAQEDKMKNQGSLISIALFASFVLLACGAPASPAATSTPVPTASPTPMRGIEVEVNGVSVRIVEMNFGKYHGSLGVTDNVDDLGTLGGFEAESGFHYAQLIIEVPQDISAEEVSKWAVTLQDSEGNAYEVAVSGWGVFLGGANKVGWTFHIPENASQLKLIFPASM
jgi:hypothetical protein